MSDDSTPGITVTDTPVDDPQPSTPEDLVGEPDGAIVTEADGSSAKIVYTYGLDGSFAGWSKEVVA